MVEKWGGSAGSDSLCDDDRAAIDSELKRMGYYSSPPDFVPSDVYNPYHEGGYDWLPAVPGLSETKAGEKVERVLEVLQPTGNPFLDLCLWKGRFPSANARFCTSELKHLPIEEDMVKPLLESYDAVVSWQGVRADESLQRAHLQTYDVNVGTWEPQPSGLLIYRPIVDWTADDVFAMHSKHGIEPNPLYKQGMSRVGCMPCIHARKNELYQIGTRFPEQIERIAEWERLVSEASKRGSATMMPVFDHEQGARNRRDTIHYTTDGIHQAVKWSKTVRGGQQPTLFGSDESQSSCESVYGLCE